MTEVTQASADPKAQALKVDRLVVALQADAGFVGELAAHLKRKDENAVNSVVLALHIAKHVQDVQLLMSLPVPGSEAARKVEGKVVEVNNNPDYYTKIDPVTGAKEETSFYWEVVRRLAPGQALENEIRLLKAAADPIGPQEGGKGDGNPYRSLGDKDRKDWLRARQSKKSTLRNACAEGFEIVQAISAANDIDGVSVDIATDPNNDMLPEGGTWSPIRVMDVSGNTGAHRDRTRKFNANGFLALRPSQVTDAAIAKTLASGDLDAAKKNGGAWIVFVNSAPPRAKKKDGQKTGTVASGGSNYPPISGMDKFYDWALTGANYLDAHDNQSKNEAKVLAWAGDPKVGDDVVLAIGKVCLSFDTIWNVIEKRYRALAAKEAATSEANKEHADKIAAMHNAA